MADNRADKMLTGSTIWAAVVVVIAFMVFAGFLINAGRAVELRGVLVLVGQGVVALVNIWIVFRATQSTNTKVDKVEKIASDVKQIVNGNTPQPGSVPPAGYVPEH